MNNNTDITVVTLNSTVPLMNSSNYKDRFLAEYWQTKIRYNKLHNMITKYDAGKLDFTPTCPIEVLREQKQYMGMYLNKLEIRALIEDINLNDIAERVELMNKTEEDTGNKENTNPFSNTPTSFACCNRIANYIEKFKLGAKVNDALFGSGVINNVQYFINDKALPEISISIKWENGATCWVSSDENPNFMKKLWESTCNS